jgi:hypothetical protein
VTSLIVYRPSSFPTHSISIPEPLNAPQPLETGMSSEEADEAAGQVDTNHIVQAGTLSSPIPAVSSSSSSIRAAHGRVGSVIGLAVLVASLVEVIIVI